MTEWPAKAVEMRPVSALVPYARNARKHTQRQVDQVAASIREWGWTVPLLVDEDGTLIAGHCRLRAAEKLEIAEVPVIVARGWSEAQKRAYVIADNKLAENASWDDDLLKIELGDLQVAGFDIELTGFELGELNDLLDDGDLSSGDNPAPPKPENPVAKRGDLWLLGRHRIICGDATNPHDVERVMDSAKAALVATDPPYMVDYTGERPNDRGKDWTDTYHEIDIKDAEVFLRSVFQNVLSVIAPHGAIYCWHAHKRQPLISRIWSELGILDHQQIVWVKPTPVFGRAYWPFQHEPCMMGWVKGSKPEHDGNNEHSSVWEFGWGDKARVVGNDHPTQKPVEIFARPMRKHTSVGAICFEPFSGSGSQIIAAEQTGRVCCAVEIEPAYVDVAIDRWQQATGQQAILESGESFDERRTVLESTGETFEGRTA